MKAYYRYVEVGAASRARCGGELLGRSRFGVLSPAVVVGLPALGGLVALWLWDEALGWQTGACYALIAISVLALVRDPAAT